MIRYLQLERLGAKTAGVSERIDGDCAHGAADPRSRQRVLESCGLTPAQLATVRQVHSIKVVQADPEQRPDADGLITDQSGVALGITVADCVPLYLIAPAHHAIALLHAGREGTRGNIAAAGVAALGEAYGVRPEALHALIGPSAGPCCYEVDDACAEDFRRAGLPTHGRHLNLWEANRRQLIAAGVLPDHIEIMRQCTICGGGFHSYRAHKTSKRNLAVLVLR